MVSRLFSMLVAVLCLFGLSACVERSETSVGVAVVDLQLDSADAVNFRRDALVAQNRCKDFVDGCGTIAPRPLDVPVKSIEASLRCERRRNYAFI